MNALPDVLESCGEVLDQARFVSLDEGAAYRWVERQRVGSLAMSDPPVELQFAGDRNDCANITLLLDCLNFCFWSDQPWSIEYRRRTWTRTYAMYAGVLRAVEEDAAWLSPLRWASARTDDVARMFRGSGQIPLLNERRQVLNETGECLLEHFDGRFADAAAQAEHDARSLAYLVADCFPSFRDAPTYRGRTVALLKRAQICAADLHHTWTRCGRDGLQGMDRLTAFADYRLPQYLRHIGVMELEPGLDARIDRQEEIAPHSEEEIELRAATVVAVELLRRAFAGVEINLPAWHIDYVLWERSHRPEVKIPHHRTQSVYY